MTCRKQGQIWVHPPDSNERRKGMTSGKLKCTVDKCPRRINPLCPKLECLTHCIDSPPCLCLAHANPRGPYTSRLVTTAIAAQIKADKMHRGPDGKARPGPAPPGSNRKRSSNDVPSICKKKNKPRAYVIFLFLHTNMLTRTILIDL